MLDEVYDEEESILMAFDGCDIVAGPLELNKRMKHCQGLGEGSKLHCSPIFWHECSTEYYAKFPQEIHKTGRDKFRGSKNRYGDKSGDIIWMIK